MRLKKIRLIIKKIPVLHSLFRFIRLHIKKIKFRKYYNDNKASLGRISFRDEMFQGDIEHYMNVGKSAINIIEESLLLTGKKFEDLDNILDMPCGHGRVMRHMVLKLDPNKITGCDLDFEAVEFCVNEFGCRGLFSNAVFEKIEFKEKYDLIWVGSLFTHLDEGLFERLLKIFIHILNDKGVLIFSAHGEYSIETIDKYDGIDKQDVDKIKSIISKDGFYFAPYENLKDYGISISLRNFVENKINKLGAGKLKLIKYTKKGWDNHHDVYSFLNIG